MRKYLFISIICFLFFGGCAGNDNRLGAQDASADSSYGNAGTGATYPDSGNSIDSGELDSGKPDSGKPDSSIDAGLDASEPSEAGEPLDAGLDASEDAGNDASEDSSIVSDQCPIPAPDNLDRFSVSTECDEPIVFDKRTGLVWTQHTELGLTLEEAIAYCSSLDYAGYTDWRLPNESELRGIYEKQIEPHSEFPGIMAIKYWTSTSCEGYGQLDGEICCVDFGDNSCIAFAPNTIAVLCVRG